MNDIKKVLIAAICVVLVVAIAAGVSIGVMAGTMNGLKDTVAELKQANDAQEALIASMQEEIKAAQANDENLVTAEDFEKKLAEALGAQTQTMQALISTAVKNQIDELGVEGLTEAQVQTIIDAAVENCLTEDDIDAIVADLDTGLTKDEVKKIVTNATAGYLTYAQIVNLVDDADYDLRKFLEDQINTVANAVEKLGGEVEELRTTATPSTIGDVINAARPGDTITLTEGEYGKVSINELKDVVITGSSDVQIIFTTTSESVIEDVTLEGFEFAYDGSAVDCGVVIDTAATIDNLVLENCTFEGTGAKAGRGLSGYNANATIVISGCTFKDLGYPIYAWGSYAELKIENCTFENIKSWAIMPQSGFDGDLTVTGCTFKNCLGGGLIKAGTLTAGHTFTFTNNTITGCTIAGDHNWFQFNVVAGTTVISGNTMDGSAWTPGTAEGLKTN